MLIKGLLSSRGFRYGVVLLLLGIAFPKLGRADTLSGLSTVKEHEVSIELPDVIMRDVSYSIGIEVPPEKVGWGEQKLRLEVNGKPRTIRIKKGKGTFKKTFRGRDSLAVKAGKHKIVRSIHSLPLWVSILPPLLAIALALIFREVIAALVGGIFLGGAFIYCYQYGLEGIFRGFFAIIDTYIIGAMNDWGHLAVILFSTTIGGVVALITRNGGMKGVVDKIAAKANTVRNGQLATWLLGIAIFFDDYANTLVVGNTMRPVTDRLRISREKLSYLVDSTAAPIASVAFITTWVGAELGYIQNGLDAINKNGTVVTEGVYSVFLNSLQYSFYPLLTLAFILMLVLRGRDFGPMLVAEQKARKSERITSSEREEEGSSDREMASLQPGSSVVARWWNGVIPILVIILGTITGLFYTGKTACYEALQARQVDVGPSFGAVWDQLQMLPSHPSGFPEKLGILIGNSDSYTALLWSSFGGLVVALGLTLFHRIMSLKDAVESVLVGFKTMLGTIIILILAWSLAGITEDMQTAQFLTGAMGDAIAPWIVPALTFILSALVAFSTGSSWGTMAIVYPLMIPTAWAICQGQGYAADASMEIVYNVVSTVLAGSVLGDHCSPISDTTILSSLASNCDHIDHVRTQLPYALTVGSVALFLGTVPGALGVSSLITIPAGLVVLYIAISLLGRKVEA